MHEKFINNHLQIGANMINGNSYEALTHNGITQLFSPTFERQEFVLQVIQVNSLSESQCDIFLSDGFAFLKGELVGDARTEALKTDMTVYSIIRFIVDDIQINSTNQPTFQLKRCFDINNKIHSVIGKPVPYKDLSRKKDYIDFGSANIISSKRTISLKEVKQMPAGKITATILAKVIKKPVKINTVMNIQIQDEEHQQIQCCFFGDSVPKYKDLIQFGQWYRFEDPVLQINNRFGNILELKINNQSKVTKQNSTEVKPGIINHNNNYINKPLKDVQKKKQNLPLKQFIMKDYEGRDNVQQFDTFVVARPLKLFVMKNSMGRTFECVNRFGQIMEILLWSDCQFQINLGETYKFQYMRVKLFRDKLSLQSQRSRTQITPSTLKILSRQEYYGEQKQQRKNNGNNTKFRAKRFLGSNDIVYSLPEMIEKSQKSKQKAQIIICCGYLNIKFDYMGGSSFDGYTELRKKLFYVHCQKCESNQYLRAKIEVQSMNGKVVCNSCKSQTVRIMWNIKATFMDSQTEIPCKINSEIADKLIQMTPSQGMLLYLEDHEKLKSKIQKKINFKRGVFKFSCKPSEKQRYYNICEYYEQGNKIFAQRSTNQLKRAFASFLKFKNWPNKSNAQNNEEQQVDFEN